MYLYITLWSIYIYIYFIEWFLNWNKCTLFIKYKLLNLSLETMCIIASGSLVFFNPEQLQSVLTFWHEDFVLMYREAFQVHTHIYIYIYMYTYSCSYGNYVFGNSIGNYPCHHFNMEQYIPYSLIYIYIYMYMRGS